MSKFYGTLRADRGKAERTGSRLAVVLHGSRATLEVYVWHDGGLADVDRFEVYMLAGPETTSFPYRVCAGILDSEKEEGKDER